MSSLKSILKHSRYACILLMVLSKELVGILRHSLDVFFFVLSVFGVNASSFHSKRSSALLFYLFLFLLSCFRITSLHISFDYPSFRCSPISIFHVLITTSSFIFFSTSANHFSLASLIFSRRPLCVPLLPLPLFIVS